MQVTIQKIPENLQEFESLAGAQRTPERICALFLCARPMTPYDQQFLRDRLRGKSYLPLAYFEGATPENGYQPRAPYTLNVLADPRPQDIEPGYRRVFLKTTGADSPRPMKLRQKGSTGEWFLWEYSSVLSGIRIPAAEDPWA